MITKTAYEEIYRYMEFKRTDGKGWLNSSETVQTAAVAVTDASSGQDASATMLSNVASYNGTQVRYLLKAGTKGKTYVVNFKIVSSNNQKFEYNLELRII